MCTPSSLCPEISQLSSRPRVPIPVIFTPDFDPSWILLGEGKGGGIPFIPHLSENYI